MPKYKITYKDAQGALKTIEATATEVLTTAEKAKNFLFQCLPGAVVTFVSHTLSPPPPPPPPAGR